MDEEATGFWPYETGFQQWFERLQGTLPEEAATETAAAGGGVLSTIGSFLLWVVGNLIEAAYNLLYAVTHPQLWLSWLPYFNQDMPELETKQALMRFIYYGASVELFFVFFLVFLIVTAVGVFRRPMLWAVVRGLEAVGNSVGRVFAWAGLLMVLQQVLIIFMQRVFAVSEITIGFGKAVSFDVSWWSEELKLYNAMIVALCVSYTFIQGGHVRVDLVYSAVSHRTKRVIDMFGSLAFMMPMAVLVWLYSWFFMWRNMINPPVSPTDTLDRMVLKARAAKWNIETIGFSPNGFNAYVLFKWLLIGFTLLVLIQAVAFFYRSYLEWAEGEESTNKYLDRDKLGDEQAERAADIH